MANEPKKKPEPGIVSLRIGERLIWHRSEGRLPPGEVSRRTSRALREKESKDATERASGKVRPKR